MRTVVDVGGGTGALLAEILRARPEGRGTLVDFPRTVARSGEIFQAAGVADRVTVVGQSFFDALPAGADLYLLKKVLNNWPDREATAILSHCAAATRPTRRVVVLGSVSPDDAPQQLVMEMVLLGGKQRTVSEFRELARAAGLEVSSRRAAAIRCPCRRVQSDVTSTLRLRQSSAGCNIAAGAEAAIPNFIHVLILLPWLGGGIGDYPQVKK